MANTIQPKIFYNDVNDARLGAAVLASAGLTDVDYPAVNLINRDRDTVAKGVPGDVDFSFPAAAEIFGIGFANLFPVTGSTLIGSGLTVFGATNGSFTGATTVASSSQAPFFGTVTSQAPKDVAIAFPSSASFRFWRVRFTGWSTIFLSRIMLFNALFDGVASKRGVSAGSTFEIITPRNRGRAIGGRPVVEDIGRQRKVFNLLFRNCDDTMESVVEAIPAQRRPYMLTNHKGVVHHVETQQDSVRFEQVFGSPNLWNTTIDAEQIP